MARLTCSSWAALATCSKLPWPAEKSAVMYPSSRAMWRPFTRPRASWISMSGLIPISRRRNTFRMACSPNTTDVLDCSPVRTRPGVPAGIAHRVRRHMEFDRLGLFAGRVDRANLDGDARRRSRRAAQRADPFLGVPLVPHRVVDVDGLAVGIRELPDAGVVEGLVEVAVDPQRHLVGLVGAVEVGDVSQPDVHLRGWRPDGAESAGPDRVDRPRLAGEPALTRQPVLEQLGQLSRVECRHPLRRPVLGRSPGAETV